MEAPDAIFEEAASRSTFRYISISTISDSEYHAANGAIEFGNAAMKQSKKRRKPMKSSNDKNHPLDPYFVARKQNGSRCEKC